MEKVLVGTPISDKKAYCIDEFISNCNNFSYLNREHYFVCNSTNIYWHAKNIVTKYGIDTDWVNPIGKRSVDYITESQNKIRKKFLEGDYTHLFLLEVDIFPKQNIIEELLSYDAPVAIARYFLGNLRFPIHTIGSEIEKNYGKITNRNISTEENFFEYGSGKTRSSMFGFGQIMICRDLVERTPFFIDEGSVSHSDSSWWMWLGEQGIMPAIHDEIAPHKNSDWGYIFEKENKVA